MVAISHSFLTIITSQKNNWNNNFQLLDLSKFNIPLSEV